MNTLRRLSVAIALAAMSGAACSGRVSQLTAELGSADEKTCESATKALGALGPGAAEAASAMLDVIVKQRRGLGPTCWMTVVDELPKLGPSVTSLLLTALGDQRAQDAAYVLASMGPSVLPAVTGALVAPTTAEGAAAAIAMLGPAGAPALPQLRQARRSNVLSEPRFLATISWSRSDETVADFVAALSSLDPEVRAMAARALKDFRQAIAGGRGGAGARARVPG